MPFLSFLTASATLAKGTFIVSAANLAVNSANWTGGHFSRATACEYDFIKALRECEASIRNATNPYDAAARQQDIMEFLECCCGHLNQGRLPSAAQLRIRQRVARELVIIDRTWSTEEKYKLLYAGIESFPDIQYFCTTNWQLIDVIERQTIGNANGRVQWRAPLPTEHPQRRSADQPSTSKWQAPHPLG